MHFLHTFCSDLVSMRVFFFFVCSIFSSSICMKSNKQHVVVLFGVYIWCCWSFNFISIWSICYNMFELHSIFALLLFFFIDCIEVMFFHSFCSHYQQHFTITSKRKERKNKFVSRNMFTLFEWKNKNENNNLQFILYSGREEI